MTIRLPIKLARTAISAAMLAGIAMTALCASAQIGQRRSLIRTGE